MNHDEQPRDYEREGVTRNSISPVPSDTPASAVSPKLVQTVDAGTGPSTLLLIFFAAVAIVPAGILFISGLMRLL